MTAMTEHRYDMDTDRCTCGSQLVYFEGFIDTHFGYGCEAAGKSFCDECEGTPTLRHQEYCSKWMAPSRRI